MDYVKNKNKNKNIKSKNVYNILKKRNVKPALNKVDANTINKFIKKKINYDKENKIDIKDLLPSDLDVSIYKLLNKDIQSMSDKEAKYHYYCFGRNENRPYKLDLPSDFDVKLYKKINTDLANHTDIDAKLHYINHGIKESRKYNFNLPNDFNVSIYKSLNTDLGHISDIDACYHYCTIGKLENRRYKNNEIMMENLETVKKIENNQDKYDDLFRKNFNNKMLSYNTKYKDKLYLSNIKIMNDNINKSIPERMINNINYNINKICFINIKKYFKNYDVVNYLSKYFNIVILYNMYDQLLNMNSAYSYIKVSEKKTNNEIFDACIYFFDSVYISHEKKDNNKGSTINTYDNDNRKIHLLYLNNGSFEHLSRILSNEMRLILLGCILDNSDVDSILFEEQMNDSFYSNYNMLKQIAQFNMDENEILDVLMHKQQNFLIVNNQNFIQEYNIKFNAIYFPQFHETPENNKFWGEGFTEWTLLKPYDDKINLRNGDNLNIIKPLNDNYYDLSDIKSINNQINLAKSFKINGFIIYHYWFNSYHKVLHKPLEYFLDPSVTFPFCISWANEHWTKNWDGLNNELLIEQLYGDESDWILHINYLIPFFQKKKLYKK